MKAIVTFTCYYSYDVEGEDEGKCIDQAYDLYRADKVSSIADTTYDEVNLEVYAMKWENNND